MGGAAEVDATRARAVGVGEDDAAERAGGLRAGDWDDEIPKLVGEVRGGNAKAVRIEVLVEANVDGTATLRAEVRVSQAARVGIKGLECCRFLDSLTISNAQARVSQKTLGVAQSVHGTETGHHACAKTCVGFGTPASAEGEARNGRPAGVEEASLVVAVSMNGGDVFRFVLIASGDCPASKRVSGLREASGAIGLIGEIPERRETANAVVAGLGGGEMVAPEASKDKTEEQENLWEKILKEASRSVADRLEAKHVLFVGKPHEISVVQLRM